MSANTVSVMPETECWAKTDLKEPISTLVVISQRGCHISDLLLLWRTETINLTFNIDRPRLHLHKAYFILFVKRYNFQTNSAARAVLTALILCEGLWGGAVGVREQGEKRWARIVSWGGEPRVSSMVRYLILRSYKVTATYLTLINLKVP